MGGTNCDNKLCLFLHPPSPLEQTLETRFKNEKLLFIAKRIKSSRELHQQKLIDCNISVRALENQRQNASDAEILQIDKIFVVKSKAAAEIISQRHSFDQAVFAAFHSLTSDLISPPDGVILDRDSQHRINREMYRLRGALPALALRNDIEGMVRTHNFLVIQGSTGSGKSTQLPAYLAEMDIFNGKKIICTQPRKLAAKSLASRVSEEWAAGSTHNNAATVGLSVGYRVGSENKTRKFTRIEYWTEGTFLQKLLSNLIDLSTIGVVVLDEAHERSIALDVIVGVLRSRHVKDFPHLKVIVTSATLDTELFSKYFEMCPILSIPGRMYPVEIFYRPQKNDIDEIVKNVVNIALEIHCEKKIEEGDILCFLTGQEEVENCVQKFSAALKLLNGKDDANVFALYGKQLPEEQELVFKKQGFGKRKIIFSTDIAETSITIDGVCFVVDSGLAKVSLYDVRRGATILEVRAISKSSADQRKGRAGRTQPGVCYRLYSEEEYLGMRISQV